MRGKKAPVRKVLSDPKYNSLLVASLVNKIMYDGKKSVALRNVYSAMEEIATLTGKEALEVLVKSVENIKPKVEVRPRRVGGSNYQVPMPVNDKRQQYLAIRWLVNAARDRRKGDFSKALAEEIVDAYKNLGGAMKKKEEVHRMAEANKAFAHLAW